MSSPLRDPSSAVPNHKTTLRRAHRRMSGALLGAVCLLSSCWTRNGSYCQIDSDCEQGLCIGYERGVKAGSCSTTLSLSSKSCKLNGIFTDSPGVNRSYGQSVQIQPSQTQTNVMTALIGSSAGFSYCENTRFDVRADIKDGLSNIPYGPSSRVPNANATNNWISSEPAKNNVFGISTSSGSQGSPYGNLKAAITSVSASSKWVAMGSQSASTIWLWTFADFEQNPSFPADIEESVTGYGRLIAVSDSQLAVGSQQDVFLYDINANNKALTNKQLIKPSGASSSFASAIALSALGLVVSEHEERSAGTTVWWYPPGAKEAQALPIPSRYLQAGQDKVFGYGAALAASDSMIAIGVPGQGSVVVLDRTASGWQEIGISTQAVGAATRFGAAVAIDNDWLAVGAPGENKVYLYLCN